MQIRSIIAVSVIIASLNLACTHSSDNQSRSSPNTNLESDKTVYKSAPTICELFVKGANLDGRKVAIDAILITGREYTYLYDPQCRRKPEKELSYSIEDRDLGDKFYSLIDYESPEYKRTGLVRLRAIFHGVLKSGKGHGFGPDGIYSYQLMIDNIINPSNVPSDVPYPWQ